ncbi:MAG TPA: ATP-grasp domain-containing protein [Candidatus Dojkabacteria bacterium]|nr:ATP-grasp domain-containing protein [Candidatus Dojkabacteria bacterium]HQF36036.1 ATP-grasp domain-containing protein [Candidatus Dojkabacteria bacterium]
MNTEEINQYLIDVFHFDPNFTIKDAKNPHLFFYMQAAKTLGIEVNQIPGTTTAIFKKDERQYFIARAETPLNNYVSAHIAGKKEQTNKILGLNNIPVPKSRKVNNIGELTEAYDEFNFSIVVKPDKGIAGRGITILPAREELQNAWDFCNEYRNEGSVIVEEYIKGIDYRLLVVKGKTIAVAKRIPASIMGDGKNTIKDLIILKNIERKKANMTEITIDDELKRRLKNDRLELDSIPNAQQTVYLRYNSNMSTGGTTEECFNEVHPYYLKLAEDACKVIGLNLGGVDLITPDIKDPTVKHGINEINRAPGLRIHYFPDKGLPQNVAKDILISLFS